MGQLRNSEKKTRWVSLTRIKFIFERLIHGNVHVQRSGLEKVNRIIYSGNTTGEISFFFGIRHLGYNAEPYSDWSFLLFVGSCPICCCLSMIYLLLCAVCARVAAQSSAVCYRLSRAEFFPLLKLFPDEEESLAEKALASYDITSKSISARRCFALIFFQNLNLSL